MKRGKTGKMCKLKAETKPIIVTAAESRCKPGAQYLGLIPISILIRRQ